MHRPHRPRDLQTLLPRARAAFKNFPAIEHKESARAGWTSPLLRFCGVLAAMTGLRRPDIRPGGDLSWCGPSHDAAHGFDFRVRLTRRLHKISASVLAQCACWRALDVVTRICFDDLMGCEVFENHEMGFLKFSSKHKHVYTNIIIPTKCINATPLIFKNNIDIRNVLHSSNENLSDSTRWVRP
jgi:hypothetical protein